jgi:hypothetical protein
VVNLPTRAAGEAGVQNGRNVTNPATGKMTEVIAKEAGLFVPWNGTVFKPVDI